MDLSALVTALFTVVGASVVIMFACDSFEDASGYLGRNMPAGVRGATINAIGSSLPELLTTMFFLFVYHDRDGFSAGIATCAGSAVFNSVIIPALCIIAVLFVGVKDGSGSRKVAFIEVGRNTIIRDGIFLIVAELGLIYFLGNTAMTWWMGGTLMVIYGVYFGYLMYQFRTHEAEDDEDDDDDDDDGEKSFLRGLVTLDFNRILFGGRQLTTGSAWAVLLCSVLVIALACFGLTNGVVRAAEALRVPTYFTAVILAAAATSVPDTVLSVKDARLGNYDDAVSNALGSNIFDISIGLGFPLFLYGLMNGPVAMSSSDGGAANVQELQVALLVVTGLVLGLFLLGKKVGRVKASLLLGVYFAWTSFILFRAIGV